MREKLQDWLAIAPRTDAPGWIQRVRLGDWSAIPVGLTYDHSAPLAMLLNGYEAARRLGAGEASDICQRVGEDFGATSSWNGSAIELWIALFFHHRADRFTVLLAPPEPRPHLDDLCRALRSRLIEGRHWPAHVGC